MISVYGEGLIDLVPESPTPLAPLKPALGGGPYNVAIAAARQGSTVAFHSRLSADAFGQALAERLRSEGVNTEHVQRGDEPTTLAVSAIDAAGAATFHFYNEGTADRLVTPQALPTDIACFGTCSLAWEPGASRYAEVLKELAGRGTLIALDPNIRPSFATPEHRDFLLGLLPYVTILKLSEEEVDFFGGLDALRAPVVIVTRGGEGLSVHTDALSAAVPSPAITVVDTIGAGDTVMGTLLRIIDEKQISPAEVAGLNQTSWEEILHTCAAAAAITCSRAGAQPPTREELEA
ncbi:carbohydrate kinase family protein [Corynebacterium lowii]|uniref:2-dehydro-3-deoxygluconokinase n=1 Tax=Corynebacterium lowii TaxID=1544413 RepID=A0A0Q1AKC2_9CORY|nr:carbohydrate kinase [Corynebacterium lowii]KQB87389.1 2-dehydro-3-deoxygluconokinase [Corynebacterium lowii]MDP9852021.1 fructokinase [Corynebacterium lowii]